MTEWIPPADLDPECLELCKALNSLAGIETFESCCGHGKYPFWIWFTWRPPANGMVVLARALCDRYYGFAGWRIVLNHTDLPESQVCFLLEGLNAKRADALARVIVEARDQLGAREYFGQAAARPPEAEASPQYVCQQEFCRERFDTLEEAMAHGLRTGHQTGPVVRREEAGG